MLQIMSDSNKNATNFLTFLAFRQQYEKNQKPEENNAILCTLYCQPSYKYNS